MRFLKHLSKRLTRYTCISIKENIHFINVPILDFSLFQCCVHYVCWVIISPCCRGNNRWQNRSRNSRKKIHSWRARARNQMLCWLSLLMRYGWLAFVDYIFLDYLQPVTLPFFKLLLTCKHGFLPVLKLHELLSMLLSSTSCKGCVCPPSLEDIILLHVLSSNVEFKLYIKKAFCPNYNWLL